MAAKQIIRGMYRAEMIKLLLTGVLFMVVFTYLPVKVGFLFVGFVLAQLTVWFAPLII
jgi:F0F1-type ATP synthase assembly protein I